MGVDYFIGDDAFAQWYVDTHGGAQTPPPVAQNTTAVTSRANAAATSRTYAAAASRTYAAAVTSHANVTAVTSREEPPPPVAQTPPQSPVAQTPPSPIFPYVPVLGSPTPSTQGPFMSLLGAVSIMGEEARSDDENDYTTPAVVRDIGKDDVNHMSGGDDAAEYDSEEECDDVFEDNYVETDMLESTSSEEEDDELVE